LFIQVLCKIEGVLQSNILEGIGRKRMRELSFR